MKKKPLKILLALLLGLALVEASLWVLHLTVGSSERAAGPGAEILCLGDSHTYGWNVDAPAAWPARLEDLTGLTVANRAAPGKNTATLLEELDEYLALDAPRLVLLQAGLNNPWSRPHQARGEGPLAWSRTARLVAILAGRLQDQAPRRRPDLGGLPEDQRPTEEGFVELELEGEDGFREVRVLTREGDVESFVVGGGSIGHDELDLAYDWIQRDLVSLCERVRAAGATPVLVTYALEEGEYLPSVNFLTREAAVETGAVLVDVAAAVEPRLEEFGRDRLFFHDAHPRREGYAVVARAVHDGLVAAGLVEGPALGDPYLALDGARPEPTATRAPGVAGTVLDLAYEPGLSWTFVLGTAAAGETPATWLELDLPLAPGDLVASSAGHAGLQGTFDGAGRARLELAEGVLAELGAAEGPLVGALVVRTRDFAGIAVGAAVPLR